MGLNILRTLHDSSKCHITRMNLIDQYNCNFYTKGIEPISKKIIQGINIVLGLEYEKYVSEENI